MKKVISTVAISALISAGAFAQSNVVTSANIVGYVQTPMPASGNFTIVALTQFSDGSTNDSISVQDVISNMSDLNSDVAGSNCAGADKLHVYTGGGYNTYALFQPASGDAYWASVNEGGWVPGLEFLGVNPSDALINRGAAIWYQTATGGIVTNVMSSGDVYLDPTFSVTVPAGFSLLAYPYSSDIALSELVISNAASAGLGSNAVGADKLHVFSGGGYNTYALFQPASGSAYWASVNEGGWVPGLEFLGVNPAALTIKLGEGFWFETATGKTITFSKIYNVQ